MTGLRSPITQRLLRHTRMAVIQRATFDSGTSFRGKKIYLERDADTGYDPAEKTKGIVQAFILSPPVQFPNGISPIVADLNTSEEKETSPEQLNSSRIAEQPEHLTPQQIKKKTPVPPGRLAQEKKPKAQENNWNLLQNIFNKHQKKHDAQQSEETAIPLDTLPTRSDSGTQIQREIPGATIPSSPLIQDRSSKTNISEAETTPGSSGIDSIDRDTPTPDNISPNPVSFEFGEPTRVPDDEDAEVGRDAFNSEAASPKQELDYKATDDEEIKDASSEITFADPPETQEDVTAVEQTTTEAIKPDRNLTIETDLIDEATKPTVSETAQASSTTDSRSKIDPDTQLEAKSELDADLVEQQTNDEGITEPLESDQYMAPQETVKENRSLIQPKYQDDQPAHTAPLQDIWPVQRHPESHIPIPEVMNKAEPGQRSDSPIEIIPPRRPRPQSAPTLTQKAPTHSKSVESLSPDTLNDTKTVQTEIGPLPQDLWRLIGHEAPQMEIPKQPIADIVSSTKLDPPRSDPMDQSIAKTQHGKTSTSKTISQQAVKPKLEPPTKLIQRTVVESEPSSEEAGTDEQQTEIDTDELSRKVYAEIKRRLTTEWERFRNLM